MGWTLLGGPQESGNHEAALQGEQETAEGRRQAQSPGGVLTTGLQTPAKLVRGEPQ